jgi:hypothetical protein
MSVSQSVSQSKMKFELPIPKMKLATSKNSKSLTTEKMKLATSKISECQSVSQSVQNEVRTSNSQNEVGNFKKLRMLRTQKMKFELAK